MQSYIGSKIINAVQMTDLEFEHERSLVIRARSVIDRYEEGGCLLRDTEPGSSSQAKQRTRIAKDGYKVMYSGGHTSWSPKNVFEEAYRLVSDDEKKLLI